MEGKNKVLGVKIEILHFGRLSDRRAMCLPFAPDPREVSFFLPLPRREKEKGKKIPRVGGRNFATKWKCCRPNLYCVSCFILLYLHSFLKKMADDKINSSKAPEPVGAYPHARKVGNLLFLSGVGPRERGTKKIPGVELDADGSIVSYDIETQCKSVFQNVKYILEDAGSSWDKIVDVQVFLTNMKDDFATYNKVYAEWFKDNLPCRTTIEINCLPTPIAIELKVIATI